MPGHFSWSLFFKNKTFNKKRFSSKKRIEKQPSISSTSSISCGTHSHSSVEGPATRTREVIVAERASSLYGPNPSCFSVSDLPAASTPDLHNIVNTRSPIYQYQHHHHPRQLFSIDDLEDLEDFEENPAVYFPTPPSRLDLELDPRHTAVWDELFEFAEGYRTSVESTTPPASPTPPPSASKRFAKFSFLSQVDLTSTGEQKQSKSRGLGTRLKGLGMRSEIWSKSSIDMTTSALPSVPPRSRLRSQAPPPLNQSTAYLLPVEAPMPYTPALSSASSSENGSPPPATPFQETLSFGRRKKSQVGLGKDPLKIRDGAEARSSTSGVYTPTTFPGAQGPRPSHFPSHVYTPSSFSLHSPNVPQSTPTNYAYLPPGPSRSASVSSVDSDGPVTPVSSSASSSSSSSRFSTFSGRAMTGLKRISHQITSNNNAPSIKAPLSARDSYFPSSIGADVPRVYGVPQTPASFESRPYSQSTGYSTPLESPGHGLGVGLSEAEGRTSGLSPESKSRTATVLFDEAAIDFSGASAIKTSPQARGRRKPVPRMLDDQFAKKIEEVTVEETHAL